ncbi:MAG TPA: transcription-repair coupling factor [Planktothrix sp.]|jgi:transcription-repair coupling factor (superfamily II helicase)
MRENLLATALHQRFLDCSQYARLLARTARSAVSELNIAGLTDSAKSLVLSVLLHEVKRPFFLVVPDNHVAAKYHAELANLTRYPVYFFPNPEVSPYEQVLSSPDNIAPQMAVLQQLMKSPQEPCIILVPVRALTQRVLEPQVIQDNEIILKVGDAVEPQELARRLARIGYSRENLVTLRGEFSIRGDIIDIFPSGGSPARIELFGDEIESIRFFNVENQRSIDDSQTIVVPPRWWVIMDTEKEYRVALEEKLREITEQAMAELEPQASETLRSVMEGDLQGIVSGSYPESCEYYASYIHEKFVTLLDYMPKNALILFDEWDSLSNSLQAHEDKLNQSFAEGLTTGRLLPLPRPLHLSIADLTANLKDKQRVYLSTLPFFTDDLESSIVRFECLPIDRFGNQMDVLLEKIRKWRKEENRVLISTDQPQRLLGLLKEWDVPAVYMPGPDEGSGAKEIVAPTATSTPQPHIGGSGDILASLIQNQQTATTNEVWVTRHGFVTGFRLEDIGLVSVTDAEMFSLKRRPTVYRRPATEKTYERFTSVADLKIGDYVVHIKHGIGQFTGVQRITMDLQQREYLTVQYSGDDRLYVPVDQINLLSRYRGAGETAPRLSRLGGAEWESTKRRVKKSVKQVAEDLVNLYAIRAKQEGFAASPDTPWQYEMEEAFPFEETPDQWQAICDSKKDLESTKPMDRLICGDVGFGKTEVAVRAIFKSVMSGKQAAILVPTTILAQQHFNTMCERFASYPIKVGLLSRFRTAKEQREVVQRLALGECDVVVGTHRMLQKDIAFKDLGLIVIDEEQRFGVAHKEKLKQLRVMVDVLTMSATPIPRTLHMALSGARDMSLINTPPTNRAPIKTFVGEYKLPLVRTAILHEMERNGQIYFVHNRVETIESVAFELKQLVPEARIAIGHGQMSEHELENVMLDFLAHAYDILVCTTIIESGLDIPNVNTIIVDQADKLGLAQLYQLRGRVGRSDVQAYAYCLFKPDKVLSEQATNRLKAIREFTSLGSGYQIALRDMEIRGVGNILGAEQHGHMVAVGFELYCKLLEESVSELKGESVSAEADAQVDLNVTAYIPESYMADNEQRLVEYKRLADVRAERQLAMLTDEWRDRFGALPVEVSQLVKIVKLRLIASKAGISAIKPDAQGIKLSVAFRLQQWLPVQNKLPKHLSTRTTYKPGSPGGAGPTPYILVRSQGISPAEQLDLLEELLDAMVQGSQEKAS